MRNSGIQKADYSQIAQYYDRVRSKPNDILVSKILEYGKVDPRCAVLDIGCGTGRFPVNISSMGKPVICALEPSIEMLRQAVAKDELRRILWIRGDGQQLPFVVDFFDCVYMTSVIHHIENREMALREIYRVLKSGGTIVVLTYSHSGIRKHITRLFPGVLAVDLKRIPSIPSLRSMMTMVGFRDVHYHVYQCDEGYVSADEYLERVSNKYTSTLALLNEGDFQRGFKIFRARVGRKYGSLIRKISRFVFVVGRK
jgi:ubiquinone/menaquinone biosynthesis C-methylase UbiE